MGADVIITGSFTEEAGGYQIESQIFDAKKGIMVSKHSKTGEKAQSINLVNEIGDQLLEGLAKVGVAPKKIAVLYFKNLISKEYDAFVGTMATMVDVSLQKLKGVSLIKRAEIQKQMEEFEIERGGVLDQSKVMQLGQNWTLTY